MNSQRGATLIELMVGVGVGTVVFAGALFMVNQMLSLNLSVFANMGTQEDLYVAALSVDRAFNKAHVVQLSATPLEGRSFTSGQTGFIRSYNFGTLSNGAGQNVLLAVFSQNIGTLTAPVYRARALVFQAPTQNNPGVLRLPMDANGTGAVNLQNEALISNLVDLQITDIGLSGGNVRSFQLRMTARYYNPNTPRAQRHYCPQADINAGRCPAAAFVDRLKITTILLTNSVNPAIPFVGFQSPLGALTDR